MMLRGAALAAIAAVSLASAGCSRHGAERAYTREPDNASRLHVAATAAAAGQTDIALSMYTAAAAAAPDDAEVQARLVSILIKAGRPDAAEETLSRALERNPKDPTLLRWSANLRLETGSAEAALQIFDGLIARNARDIPSLNGRGVALDLLGQHEAAQQSYRIAQSIAPADLQTANNLAVSYLLSSRPAQARDVLANLAQRSNLPPRILNNLAIARESAGTPGVAGSSGTASLSADDLRTLAASLGPSVTAPPVGAPDAIVLNKPSG